MKKMRLASLALALLAWALPASAATLAAGRGHTVVRLPDGTLWAWGANDHGQLGAPASGPALTPIPVGGIDAVVAVAAGGDHVLALKSDKTLWAWGRNDAGQVGDGTTEDRSVPVLILADVAGMAAGPSCSFAWTDDGILYAWGANDHGQQGNGTTAPRDTPGAVAGLAAVAHVSAGRDHVLALTQAGETWGWGASASGTDELLPVQVTALPSGSQVVAGDGASYVLVAGSLHAVGANGYGQLGDGTTADRLTASAVTGVTGAAALRTGAGHVLALLADRQLLTWGRNDRGQLGREGDTLLPAALGLSGIVDFAAGATHSVAVDAEGIVWTWGENTSGQLGDGTTADAAVPQAISGPGFSWKLGRPVMTPPPGRYSEELGVGLSSVTQGASIRYTTDGSEPGEMSFVLPAGDTISVDETTTIKAQATKPGRTASLTSVGAYTLEVPAVGVTPPGGTYDEPQTVTLSSIDGATIHYTLDGTEPSEASPEYSGPVTLETSRTVRARAYREGWEPSALADAAYLLPGLPEGASVDQRTDLSVASPAPIGPQAQEAISAALEPKRSDSGPSEEISTEASEAPVISPPGGTFAGVKRVQVTTATPGATLHYTLDGSLPLETDPAVGSSGTLLLNTSATLTVRAFAPGLEPSDTSSADFTLERAGSVAADGHTAWPSRRKGASGAGAPMAMVR